MADEKKQGKSGEHQDNLAEGEPETVEESIRQHEQKKDQQGQPAKK